MTSERKQTGTRTKSSEQNGKKTVTKNGSFRTRKKTWEPKRWTWRKAWSRTWIPRSSLENYGR